MDNEPTGSGKDKEAFWSLWNARADVAHKVGVLIVGSIVAAIFYFYQQQQLRSRYLADLMAQRENADSSLRATMFKTLFEAYFDKQIESGSLPILVDKSSHVPSAGISLGSNWAAKIKQELIFADLLARNFENIDVRPLLEDLDTQLSEVVGNSQGTLPPTADQHKAFRLRGQLRRAAIGAVSRQTTSLVGNAGAKFRYGAVVSCEDKLNEDSASLFDDVDVHVNAMREGHISIGVLPTPGGALPQSFDIGYYDMPQLENVIIPDANLGQRRVAFTLIQYISHVACSRFRDDMEPIVRASCDDLPAGNCDAATIGMVLLPKGYISPSDRPYMNDLIERTLTK